MADISGGRLKRLAGERHDLVIVGGGAYGAFAAWDAALRGLRVTLIERNDFGSGTSSNSLKLVHGGLRYLQHGDLARMRQSIRERAILLRAAPHLVRPQPCVLPTFGRGARGRTAFAAALALNDVISFDRNLGADPARQIPRGRVIDPGEYERMAGPLAVSGATGAALWHDAVMVSSERLLMSILRSAVAAGAEALNYVEALSLIRDGSRVVGVRVRAEGGDEAELRTRVVLNAAGPWCTDLLGEREQGGAGLASLVRGYNVIVRRAELPAVAAAVPVAREGRMLFAVPWRGALMLGTGYSPGEAPAGARVKADEAGITQLVADFNSALPAFALRRGDVGVVHAGLLPGAVRAGVAIPGDRPRVVDHRRLGGVSGLVSLQGVKWTTARAVAAEAVDLCQRQLGQAVRPGGTHAAPLFGGGFASLNEFEREAPGELPVSAESLRHLKELYGTAYHDVLELARVNPGLASPVAPGVNAIGAQVVYAVREEQARHLNDVMLRRAEMATTGHPGDAAVQAVALLMSKELGWDERRRDREMAAFNACVQHSTMPE